MLSDDGSGRASKRQRGDVELADPRASQACIKCRRQKMKCLGSHDPPCLRCRRTGLTCEFVPRANAATTIAVTTSPSHSCTEPWRDDVSLRIQRLEESNRWLVGELRRLGSGPDDVDDEASPLDTRATPDNENSSLRREMAGLWSALGKIWELDPSHKSHEAWSAVHVGQLWRSFQKHSPGLHFFSGQVSFSQPTPLLAAAILHVSALHSPSAQLARFQPVYFRGVARAIAKLAIPVLTNGPKGPTSPRELDVPRPGTSDRFDDVLGIILTGLTTLGWVEEVGLWVGMGYRLLLEGLAEEHGRRIHEWRGLWEGLRVCGTIELEHSSLHLITPALPRFPPSPPFPSEAIHATSPSDAVSAMADLLQIMQTRMATFVSRGLPTLWETVCAATPVSTVLLKGQSRQQTANDVATIHGWANELDSWYANYAERTRDATNYVRVIILLNYHLHKLFVLSVFYPLKGVDISDIYTFSEERAELLASSRLVLRIEQNNAVEIWSNWDLVMITSASLIVLDIVSIGGGLPDDLNLVQNHLLSLRRTQQPAPSLRHTLSHRLEQALQRLRTPPANFLPDIATTSPPVALISTLQPPDSMSTRQLLTPVANGHDNVFASVTDLVADPGLAFLDGIDPVSLGWPPVFMNWFEQSQGLGDVL